MCMCIFYLYTCIERYEERESASSSDEILSLIFILPFISVYLNNHSLNYLFAILCYLLLFLRVCRSPSDFPLSFLFFSRFKLVFIFIFTCVHKYIYIYVYLPRPCKLVCIYRWMRVYFISCVYAGV